jgi:diadenosine tetraphosphate (Ap4A) HIT family hydrolase
MAPGDCPFCTIAADDVIDAAGTCVAIWTGEPPIGSLMVIPLAHRTAPWDLSHEEWSDTHLLLQRMRDLLLDRFAPDGFNVRWNVGPVGGQSIDHAHCHLIPRYADEPYAGRGLRWWFKQPENARPGSSSA